MFLGILTVIFFRYSFSARNSAFVFGFYGLLCLDSFSKNHLGIFPWSSNEYLLYDEFNILRLSFFLNIFYAMTRISAFSSELEPSDSSSEDCSSFKRLVYLFNKLFLLFSLISSFSLFNSSSVSYDKLLSSSYDSSSSFLFLIFFEMSLFPFLIFFAFLNGLSIIISFAISSSSNGNSFSSSFSSLSSSSSSSSY